MTETERQKRLTAALIPLSKGQSPDGKPLDFAAIAVDAHAVTRAFAHRIAVGQARASTRRFKG